MCEIGINKYRCFYYNTDNSGHPLECNLNFTVLCTSDTTANVSWGTGREGSTCSALDWGYDCYNAAFQVTWCQPILFIITFIINGFIMLIYCSVHHGNFQMAIPSVVDQFLFLFQVVFPVFSLRVFKTTIMSTIHFFQQLAQSRVEVS